MLTAIPCTLMRGGTSKGLYFHADDLPDDRQLTLKVLYGSCRVFRIEVVLPAAVVPTGAAADVLRDGLALPAHDELKAVAGSHCQDCGRRTPEVQA